jgi:DNA-binding helix-hairpin-helix protein with protein kinase domain
MAPPPATVKLKYLTPKVAQLFELAFSPLHLGSRPSAMDWITALVELERGLTTCARSRVHRYSKEARECPWCRMEAEYGRPVFVDADMSSALPDGRLDARVGLVLDLGALLAAINGVPVPQSITLPLPSVATPAGPSDYAKAAKRRQDAARLCWAAGGTLGVLAAYLLASHVSASVVLLSLLAGIVFVLLGVARRTSDLTERFIQQAGKIKARVEHLQSTSPIARVLLKKTAALSAVEAFKLLSNEYTAVQTEYEKVRRKLQLGRYLSTHPIRVAHIPKLTSADLASLSSYGFTTPWMRPFAMSSRSMESVRSSPRTSLVGWAGCKRHSCSNPPTPRRITTTFDGDSWRLSGANNRRAQISSAWSTNSALSLGSLKDGS